MTTNYIYGYPFTVDPGLVNQAGVTQIIYTLVDAVTQVPVVGCLPNNPITITGYDTCTWTLAPLGTYNYTAEITQNGSTYTINSTQLIIVGYLSTTVIDDFDSTVLSLFSATSPISYNNSTGVISMSNSGVSSGTYNTVTVSTQGIVTAATNTSYLTTAIVSLNGLTASTQVFALDTSNLAPTWTSTTATHTLSLPLASTASVTAGMLSNADYTTFMSKQSSLGYTPANKAGDTFTGNVGISSSGGVNLSLDRSAGNVSSIYYTTSGSKRWQLAITGDPEGGGNTGSNFTINSYTDGGSFLYSTLTMYRSTGNTWFWEGIGLNGGTLYFSSSNTYVGNATLVGGTIAVANTLVFNQAFKQSKLLLTVRTIGGTPGTLSYTVTDGVGFTITSSSGSDTSTIEYIIYNIVSAPY